MIYFELQNGLDFVNVNEQIDINFLKTKKDKLLNAIQVLEIEISEIKDDEVFLLLESLDDLDNYFLELKSELEDELESLHNKLSVNIEQSVKAENSQYSEKLYQIQNPTFDKIREISVRHIMEIGNPDNLHTELQQGVTIIQDENLLYKYIFNYGNMHKAKLYSAFDTFVSELDNHTINIIDYGCGQALATSLFLDYIKEKNLNINISNTILIEPSELALSRGLLHLDILKDSEIEIKAINKDLDSLETQDIIIDNSNITLHLLSNILDVEFFKLDKDFLDKVADSQNGLTYFLSVSPNINDKRNSRLDIFYQYFKDNFKAELISYRFDNLNNNTRYERIFKTKVINETSKI